MKILKVPDFVLERAKYALERDNRYIESQIKKAKGTVKEILDENLILNKAALAVINDVLKLPYVPC